ncbi:MAG: hypothetical protein HOP23_09760 [Methylococcaceae bacterium]|nr:hypothetical protein [Methylococcaceae bacterium]
MTTDELIAEIKIKFNSSVMPNGDLLGWDRNRFYEPLQLLLNEYAVINQTDFNYSYCNSFDINMNTKGNFGEIYKITLKISFILDMFTIHLTKYSKDKKMGKVVSQDTIPEAKFVCDKLRYYLSQINFEELYEDIDVEIPGIQLELAQKATVGKCLFDDF